MSSATQILLNPAYSWVPGNIYHPHPTTTQEIVTNETTRVVLSSSNATGIPVLGSSLGFFISLLLTSTPLFAITVILYLGTRGE